MQNTEKWALRKYGRAMPSVLYPARIFIFHFGTHAASKHAVYLNHPTNFMTFNLEADCHHISTGHLNAATCHQTYFAPLI